MVQNFIGQKIKTIRERKKLTQEYFSKSIDISRSLLSQIEAGKSTPTFETITKIISAYKINANYFFSNYELNNVIDTNIEWDINDDLSKVLPLGHRRSDQEIIAEKIRIEKFTRTAKQLKNKLESQFKQEEIKYLDLIKNIERFEELVSILHEVMENYIQPYIPELDIYKTFLNPNPALPSFNEYKKMLVNHLKIIIVKRKKSFL